MNSNAAIFDMDGLLIDSEPYWEEAGSETLMEFGQTLTVEQYQSSTGLRTEEWIAHWFRHFNLPMQDTKSAVETIIRKAIEKIDANALMFPGVESIISFFQERGYKIGLATSSPLSLVQVVLKKAKLEDCFDAIASAEKLPFGKPHPEVYLNCASMLGVAATECIAFEDSFNGMIAAKAARMKCVLVPATAAYDHPKWNAADLKIRSLLEFNADSFMFL